MPPALAIATANFPYADTPNELHPKASTNAPQGDAEIEAHVSRAIIRR
jgi:hypothetical protein